MPLIEVRDVVKAHGGLRPFRLRSLVVDPAQVVAIEGPDRDAAAVLTDLLTGAALPDSGSVVVDGRSTAGLSGQDDWLAFLDRFGIVNERVALLDALTVAANLGVPHTLDLDPLAPEIRRAVEACADEVGLARDLLDSRLGDEPPLPRLLVRIGRAVAHDPAVLIVEHPTLGLSAPREITHAAEALGRVSQRRRLATLVITADRRFIRILGATHLAWRPATGDLAAAGRWPRWFDGPRQPHSF
jgi:ABC-type transporter Mla maintaining outer membrane lipid asymmetry ATPase subunit MlaF